MKHIFPIILLFLSLPFFSQAQDSNFVLLRSYEGDIADAAMDHLGNLYVVTSSGQVRKYNASGDSLAVYNQVRNYGKLTTLDVSNPLKPLLFYKDFSSIVVLDRFLASLSTIDLRRYAILQPVAIGPSYDDNIWVFDEYDNKLKKIDQQGNHLLETADLRTVFDGGIRPVKIIDDNGLVYLADTASGIFVFDSYGSFKKKIPLLHWQSIAISRNQVTGSYGEKIVVFNTSTFIQQERKAPVFTPYVHSFISGEKFIRFSSGRLQIFQIHY